MSFAGIENFIDNPVRNYSSGMYIRLGFAVAVHMDPDILLIDEVIAVGDEAFQAKCMERIRKFQDDGKTILIVTHAVDGIRDLCTQAALLSTGHLAAYGNPAEVIRQYRNKVSRTPEGEKIDHLTAVDIEKVTLTDPAGTVALNAVLTVPTARPTLVSLAVASARVRFTTSGTMVGGPDETIRLTALPACTCVPAPGF